MVTSFHDKPSHNQSKEKLLFILRVMTAILKNSKCSAQNDVTLSPIAVIPKLFIILPPLFYLKLFFPSPTFTLIATKQRTQLIQTLLQVFARLP